MNSVSALALLALSSRIIAAPTKETMEFANYILPSIKALSPLRNPEGGKVVGHCNPDQLYCYNQIVYDLSKHYTSSNHPTCT